MTYRLAVFDMAGTTVQDPGRLVAEVLAIKIGDTEVDIAEGRKAGVAHSGAPSCAASCLA